MMKLYKFVFLLLLSMMLSGCLESSREAPASIASKYGNDVVLYATSWCGYCQKTREYFSKNNISYIEYDIETSDYGLQEFESLGGKGVPLVLVKGRVVEGYAPGAIAKILEDG